MDGGVVISDGQTWTAPADGGARWVSFLTDTVLSNYAGNLVGAGTYLPGTTLTAGLGLGGITTSIAVTTGIVAIYEFGNAGTVA